MLCRSWRPTPWATFSNLKGRLAHAPCTNVWCLLPSRARAPPRSCCRGAHGHNSVSSRTVLGVEVCSNLLLPSLWRSLHLGQERRSADFSGVHEAWSVALDPPFQETPAKRSKFAVRPSPSWTPSVTACCCGDNSVSSIATPLSLCISWSRASTP